MKGVNTRYLRARYERGWSFKAIAERYGLPLQQVKRQLTRRRKKCPQTHS